MFMHEALVVSTHTSRENFAVMRNKPSSCTSQQLNLFHSTQQLLEVCNVTMLSPNWKRLNQRRNRARRPACGLGHNALRVRTFKTTRTDPFIIEALWWEILHDGHERKTCIKKISSQLRISWEKIETGLISRFPCISMIYLRHRSICAKSDRDVQHMCTNLWYVQRYKHLKNNIKSSLFLTVIITDETTDD